MNSLPSLQFQYSSSDNMTTQHPERPFLLIPIQRMSMLLQRHSVSQVTVAFVLAGVN